ncbi:hypothetical protein LEP3755_34180 [Leptolyngbya sp. NIES-3755]|nr:hypothetical protein LEP3755_34180 [Leptolyngbya sp. NIES-3755]
MSRFIKRETINVFGVEVFKVGSLLKREREALLKVRRDLFDQTKAFLDLSNQMSEDLGITQDEAWALINSNGINQAGEDLRAKILPYMIELQKRLDPNYAQQEYPSAAIEIFLRSRLDSNWIKEAAPDLEQELGLKLDKNQLAAIQKVPFADYLDDPIRKDIIRRLVQLLPEYIYDEILDLLDKEQRQWKPVEPQVAEEVIDESDPLP